MKKKMIMRKLLSCLEIIAILMSAVQVSIFALNYDFNVDTGRNLASSSTWKFWSENSDLAWKQPRLEIV